MVRRRGSCLRRLPREASRDDLIFSMRHGLPPAWLCRAVGRLVGTDPELNQLRIAVQRCAVLRLSPEKVLARMRRSEDVPAEAANWLSRPGETDRE